MTMYIANMAFYQLSVVLNDRLSVLRAVVYPMYAFETQGKSPKLTKT